MLSCEDLSVCIGPNKVKILNGAKAAFAEDKLHAVIGPSGCGKTTLMKAMLGILPTSEGTVYLRGQAVDKHHQWPGEVGFAPQFSIAQPHLTVEESLRYALDLYVSDAEVKRARLKEILERTGLDPHREKKVGSLSGGQLRRLGLSLELTGDPACLVCDEVTSGLDPRSEDHILEVMRGLQAQRGKTFICIIHNLAKLEQFDEVTVVHDGTVVFQGAPERLNQFFGIADPLHLYDRLNAEGVDHWRERWEAVQLEAADSNEADPDDGDQPSSAAARTPVPLPGLVSQVGTLLRRRGLLFMRDKGYLFLTLGITLGFPCLVVIFALGGLPEVRGLALDSRGGILEQIQDNIRFQITAMQTASLVTGLIMFQVILLTLMGSNNGAREIAGERTLYEKERFAGLRPEAYGISKLVFCSAVAAIQGLYMTFFVKLICGFPGPWLEQAGVLALACVAMTVVCLGISAMLNSGEKASLLSVYLVGFQLPLSGIVLALPEALVWVCRPFINAYWGWGGYFGSMIDTRLFDAFRQHETAFVPSAGLAAAVLLIHVFAGACMVFWGCLRRGWK